MADSDWSLKQRTGKDVTVPHRGGEGSTRQWKVAARLGAAGRRTLVREFSESYGVLHTK